MCSSDLEDLLIDTDPPLCDPEDTEAFIAAHRAGQELSQSKLASPTNGHRPGRELDPAADHAVVDGEVAPTETARATLEEMLDPMGGPALARRRRKN